MSVSSLDRAQKPVTAQKVRAVLKKAGYAACKRHKTRIPGWYNYTAGSEVLQRDEALIINWTGISHWKKGEDAEKERRTKVEAMRRALLDAGIVAALERTDWGHEQLRVRL